MFSLTLNPTKEDHTIEIPVEFYGKEVLITVKETKPGFRTRQTEDHELLRRKYGHFKKIDLKKLPFNREEANRFDD